MMSVGFVDARIPFVSFGILIRCDEGRQDESVYWMMLMTVMALKYTSSEAG